MKKSDLRSGDIVETREGSKYMVLLKTRGYEYGNILINLETGGYLKLDVLSEDMTGYRKLFDVMKVYYSEYVGDTFRKLGIIKNFNLEEWTWERNEEILDKEEKRYLKNVIRPFKKEIKTIEKRYFCKKREYIFIKTTNSTMSFPVFEEGTMYKNMERNREYTLEELGL